ncbi:hypothetical protein HerbRD11066_59390 [Herbidospora sp. RD11066]
MGREAASAETDSSRQNDGTHTFHSPMTNATTATTGSGRRHVRDLTGASVFTVVMAICHIT